MSVCVCVRVSVCVYVCALRVELRVGGCVSRPLSHCAYLFACKRTVSLSKCLLCVYVSMRAGVCVRACCSAV